MSERNRLSGSCESFTIESVTTNAWTRVRMSNLIRFKIGISWNGLVFRTSLKKIPGGFAVFAQYVSGFTPETYLRCKP